MRVLGKPELSNAIKLVDLETLMQNFGPPSPRENATGASAKPDKQKQPEVDEAAGSKPNKRKMQIGQLIKSDPEHCLEILAMVDAVGIDEVKSRLQAKVYKMLAKLKKNNKQINESVVNREDFIDLFKQINGIGISDETLAVFQSMIQVNPNHPHIF